MRRSTLIVSASVAESGLYIRNTFSSALSAVIASTEFPSQPVKSNTRVSSAPNEPSFFNVNVLRAKTASITCFTRSASNSSFLSSIFPFTSSCITCPFSSRTRRVASSMPSV